MAGSEAHDGRAEEAMSRRAARGNRGRGGMLPWLVMLGVLTAVPATAQVRSAVTASGGAAQQQKSPDFREDPRPASTVMVQSGRRNQRIEITIQRLGGGLPPLPGEEARPHPAPRRPGEPGGEQAQTFTVSVVEKPDFMTAIRWESPQRVVFEPGAFEKTVTLAFDTSKEPPDTAKAKGRLVLLVKADDPTVIPNERRLVIPLNTLARPGDLVLDWMTRDPGDDIDVLGERTDEEYDLTAATKTVQDGVLAGYAMQTVFKAPPRITPGEDFSIGLCGALGLRNKGRRSIRPWPKDVGEEFEFTTQVEAAVSDGAMVNFGDKAATAAARSFTQVNLPLQRGGEVNPTEMSEILFRYDPEKSLPPYTYHYKAEVVSAQGQQKPRPEGRKSIFFGRDWSGGEIDIELSHPPQDTAHAPPPRPARDTGTGLLGQPRGAGPPPEPNDTLTIRFTVELRRTAEQHSRRTKKWLLVYRKPVRDRPVRARLPDYASGGGCPPVKVKGKDLYPFGTPILKLVKIMGPKNAVPSPAPEGRRGDLLPFGDGLIGLAAATPAGGRWGAIWPRPAEPPSPFLHRVQMIGEGGTAPRPSVSRRSAMPQSSNKTYYVPNSMGYTRLSTRDDGYRDIVSMAIRSAPKEIVPGQPFTVTAGVVRRIHYQDDHSCYWRRRNETGPRKTSLRLSVGPTNVFARGTGDLNSYCEDATLTKHRDTGVYYLAKSTEKQSATTVTMTFKPVKKEAVYGHWNYFYDVTYAVHGKVESQRIDPKLPFYTFDRRTDGNGFLAPGTKVTTPDGTRLYGDSILIHADTITLRYAPLLSGEPTVTPVPYEPPAELGRPPRESRGGGRVAGEEGTGSGTGTGAGGTGAGGAGARGTGAGGGTGAGTGAGSAGGTGGAGAGGGTQVASIPTDPRAVDPTRPNVAALITEFLRVAEPVQNVTEGASFRFDPWGDLTGHALGGVILPRNAKPDDAGARTPTQYAWEERRNMDSVDHCTMEKYVMARLQGASLAGCVGIHKGTVAKVVGLTVRQAKAQITPFKYTVRLRPGTAAPTAAKSGTVERQDPPPGTKLKRGQQVTLWIHAPYVDQRTVPDLAGMSSKEAKAAVKKAGLKARVRLGRAAASPAATGRVERQEPAAGAKVKPGTRVAVVVFTPFVANQRTVPDLAGLSSRQARERIKRAGLTAKVAPGPVARSRADTGKVATQEPGPGTKVKAGSRVLVRVFTPPVNASRVPSLVGLTFDQAQARLAQAGLTAQRRDAGQPRSPGDAGKVTGQDPAAGTEVKRGAAVVVSALGAYVPSQREQVAGLDCRRWPNSEAAWDSTRNQAVCRCSAGYEWRQSENACRRTKETQIAIAKQICAGQLRGSIAAWDEASRSAKCVCPQGTRPNRDGSACVTGGGGQPGGDSYFVGLWAYAQAACSGRPPPPRPSQGTSGGIGEAIGESIAQAMNMLGLSLFPDGTFQALTVYNRQTLAAGRWAHRNGVLSFTAMTGNAMTGSGLVRERRPDRMVVTDQRNGQTVTMWRCSTTPLRGNAAGGGGATGGSGGSGGGSATTGRRPVNQCYALADRGRQQLESHAATGRQVEQQLRAAGCANLLSNACPSGNFGQNAWPECLSALGYRY